MPLGTTYNVTTKYRVDTTGTDRKVRNLVRQTDRMARRADHARDKLRGLFTGVKFAAGGALALGLGLAGRRMFQLGKAAEQAEITIAGTFQTLARDANTFEQNLARADDLFERFSERSITSPATGAEFRQLFGGVAPAVAPLGRGNEEIAQFIQRSVGAGVAFTGGDFEQAGRDLRMMLEGRGGADVKTFQALKQPLFEQLGIGSTEEFNKLAKAEPNKVFDALNESLTALDPALQAYSESTTGMLATTQELVDRGLREMFFSMAESLRPELERFIGFMMNNMDDVKEFGRDIGDILGGGIELVGDLASFAKDHIDALIVSAGVLAGMRLGSNIMDFMALARTSSRNGAIASVGEFFGFGKYANTKFGSSVGLAARGGGSYRAAMTTVGPAMAASGGGGAIATLTGHLKALAAAAGPVVGILIPVITILGTIAGTVRTFTADLTELNDRTITARRYFAESWRELVVALDELAIKFGSDGIGDLINGFTEFLGTGLVGAIGGIIDAFGFMVRGLSLVATVIQGIANGFAELYMQYDRAGGGVTGLAALDAGEAFRKGMIAAGDEFKEDEKRAKQLADQARKAAEDSKRPENQGAPTVNVTNNITQHVTTDADPDRIALRSGTVAGNEVRRAVKPAFPGI